jgi:hypothetical protein
LITIVAIITVTVAILVAIIVIMGITMITRITTLAVTMLSAGLFWRHGEMDSEMKSKRTLGFVSIEL